MVWILKKFIKIFIIVAILLLIVGLVFAFFIDPTNFRSQINNSLQNYTGQPLQVQGAIEWTLRPKAKLKLHDVVLNQVADGKTPILKIKEALVDFDGFSYFTDNLVITNLELKDVAIDRDWMKNLPKANPKNKSSIKALTIKNLSLLNPAEDQQLSWQLKNSVLSANNITINANSDIAPIKIRGDLTHGDTGAVFNLDGVLKIEPKKNSLVLDPLKILWNGMAIAGNATIVHYENDTAITGLLSLDNTEISPILTKLDPYYSAGEAGKIISGQVNYGYQIRSNLLELTDIKLQLNNGTLAGHLKASLVAPHQLEFNITTDNLDLSPLFLLRNAMFPTVPNDNLLPVDFIKDLTLNGKFTGTNVHFNHAAPVEQISFNVVAQNGVMQFNPIIISAYGAAHNMHLNIDVVSKDQPSFQITEQVENFNIEPWLNLIQQKEIIGGKASIKASFEALGNSVAMLKQTLSGSINMYVSDGILYDLDIAALMDFTDKAVNDLYNQMAKAPNSDLRALAISKSSEWINSQPNSANTKFDQFEIKADIEQGVSKKASISMTNSMAELKATGGFNLQDDTIDFNGTLVSKKGTNSSSSFLAKYMQQTALPILITGTIQKPIFGPNIQEYTVNIIGLAKKDLLNIAITKMIAITPPNIKTPKSGSELFLDSLQSLSSK